MTILLILITLLITIPTAYADEIKPLYQLPEKITSSSIQDENDVFLVGSDSGLYKITGSNYVISLWTQGRVDQIAPVQLYNEASHTVTNAWYFRTDKGILRCFVGC